MWGKVSCLTKTIQWQGPGLEQPTFRSEVQRANHYTTVPPCSLVALYNSFQVYMEAVRESQCTGMGISIKVQV